MGVLALVVMLPFAATLLVAAVVIVRLRYLSAKRRADKDIIESEFVDENGEELDPPMSIIESEFVDEDSEGVE